MRADIHTHLWPAEETPEVLRDYFNARGLNIEEILSGEGLVRSMEGVCELAVVSTLAPARRASNQELAAYHAYVARHVQRAEGRLLAFCTADPFGGEESVRCIERYIEQGFAGLKLHPNIQGFCANDERVFPLYEKMQEYGLPVLFHTGGIGVKPFFDRYGDCKYVEEVACRFPEMPIIMGHAGRGIYTETASILRKHKNVYADVSANFAKLKGGEHLMLAGLLTTVKMWIGSTEKLLFGSDYPFYQGAQTAALLLRMEQQPPELVTPEEIRSIREENAYRFLEKHVLHRLRGDL